MATTATLLTTGTIAPLTLAAADALMQLGFDPLVLHFPSVKPLEDEALANCLRRYPVVATMKSTVALVGLARPSPSGRATMDRT